MMGSIVSSLAVLSSYRHLAVILIFHVLTSYWDNLVELITCVDKELFMGLFDVDLCSKYHRICTYKVLNECIDLS